MDNITLIVPVHEFNDEVKKYLTDALNSIGTQEKIDYLPKVLVVLPSKIKSDVEAVVTGLENKLNLEILVNDIKTDFQSQVNFASDNVDTDYFALLEFDDVLGTTYFSVAEKYIKAYPDVDLFLPFLVETTVQNQSVKLTNEHVWARNYVGENGVLGFLNTRVLEQVTDFKFSGGIFKKTEFDSYGKLKSNIKLTFTLEFLYRILNNGGKIYSIPKIVYKHVINREGSLFDMYGKTMSMPERKFWFDTAKKESNFLTDREIDMSLLTPSKK
jgi:hypothetical protein